MRRRGFLGWLWGRLLRWAVQGQGLGETLNGKERKALYKTRAWKWVARAARKRDGYRCRRCGAGKKGKRSLALHHIRPFSRHPELRLELDNLVLLCRACHCWVHSGANVWNEYRGG